MQDKIIIHSDIDNDLVAVRLVAIVIEDGKISNYGNQYCYATTFQVISIGRVTVSCDWNKKNTYTFRVFKER